MFKDRKNVDNANIQFIIRVRNNLQSSNAKTEVDVKDMVMVALMYIGEDDDKERGSIWKLLICNGCVYICNLKKTILN